MAERRSLRPAPGLEIPVSEIVVRASRSGGPGGQHANTTASRIEASLELATASSLSDRQRRRLHARYGPRVTAVAQDSRSQTRNRELALERLERRIGAALRLKRSRRPTRPGRAAKERRLEQKRQRGQRKRARRRPDTGDW